MALELRTGRGRPIVAVLLVSLPLFTTSSFKCFSDPSVFKKTDSCRAENTGLCILQAVREYRLQMHTLDHLDRNNYILYIN